MGLTSLEYLCFLAVVVVLFRICPRRLKPTWILLTSYIFYLTWSVKAAALLAVITLLTFVVGLIVEKMGSRGSRLAIAMTSLLVAYLMAFKVALLTPQKGIAGLIMPLGVSYYSFKLLAYVLNVHWGKMKASRNLIEFAAYVAFFPQIVAGPIQRPEDFFSQRPFKPVPVMIAFPRIAWGFFKKLLIADNLAPVVNYVFAHTGSLHGASLALGFYLFPLQMYADFSGLTDIAIGSGLLFGIRGPENFNRPFTAPTISEYWRRWHMSLTYWLADYVFLPLRMATRHWRKAGLAASITINMVLIGLWHGLATTYLAFGLIHSVFLVLDAFKLRIRSAFLTFHMAAFALVFFRAAHVSEAVQLVGNLFREFPNWSLASSVIALTGERAFGLGVVGYLILELVERYRPEEWVIVWYDEAPRWGRWSLYSACAVTFVVGMSLLLVHVAGHRSAFIYEIF